MRLRLSAQAIRDLQEFGKRIATDNPPRAVSFLEQLRDAARRIGGMPRAFPLIPRYEQHGIRRGSWKDYGILYSVQSGDIFVHRIIGPGQDHDRTLRLN
jgi:plasmid stabilization system protein ParE